MDAGEEPGDAGVRLRPARSPGSGRRGRTPATAGRRGREIVEPTNRNRGGTVPQLRRLFSILGVLLGSWIAWELGSLVSRYVGIVATLVGGGVGWSVGRRYAERNFF